MHAKFQGDQKSVIMSSIDCLNSNFCSLKQCITNKFMDQMINNIRLA